MSHLKVHKDDIKKIREVVLTKTQVTITAEEACNLWETYSDKYAAGWIFLPETTEEIWSALSTIDLTDYVGWTASDLKYDIRS